MAAASGAQVKVATVAKYGQVLVAADGKTLYLFEKDNGTTSACTSAQCTGIWPAYAGPASAGSGVTASKLSTATGQVADQVVYNGHLLYEFSGDKAAGDVNGTSIPEWYPVSPAGDKVDES
jgi:predicted lipoprotein with Yx(FWY)xxD motif